LNEIAILVCKKLSGSSPLLSLLSKLVRANKVLVGKILENLLKLSSNRLFISIRSVSSSAKSTPCSASSPSQPRSVSCTQARFRLPRGKIVESAIIEATVESAVIEATVEPAVIEAARDPGGGLRVLRGGGGLISRRRAARAPGGGKSLAAGQIGGEGGAGGGDGRLWRASTMDGGAE